jgi:4-hydroxybenzoate polyprenyltransferase
MADTPLWRTALQLNILVASAGASVAAGAAWLSGAEVSWLGVAVAFGVAFLVYNLDRVIDDSPAEGTSTPERAATMQRSRGVLRWLLPLLGVSLLGAALSHSLEALAWTLALPLAGAAYVLPVIPLGPWRRAKDIPYLKCFYVAATLTIPLVGIGVTFSGGQWNTPVLAFTGLVAVRFFASTNLGDLRDVEDDRRAGMTTLASVFGEARSHRMLGVVHLLSAAAVGLAVVVGTFPIAALGFLPAIAFAARLQACYRNEPRDPELVLELYELEVISFGPTLFLLG